MSTTHDEPACESLPLTWQNRGIDPAEYAADALLVAGHIRAVQDAMADLILALGARSARHDASKYEPQEARLVAGKPKLDALKYMSDAYRKALEEVGPDLDHHYAVNEHHPEYHDDGIAGMSLIDLLEMLADWRAASQANGSDIETSLERNVKRFDIPPSVARILQNTIDQMNW